MTTRITIIGLGQIGSSFGLALSDQAAEGALERIGHDKNPGVARESKKMGAVDRVRANLFRAIQDADLVLLALPLDQIHETLSLIGEDLREDAVVMDTAPVKGIVARWASELLPAGRHYVGLTPVLNPAYLHGLETGVQAARKDLFHKGLMGVVTSEKANAAAVKLAVDLADLLGATPLFVDALEVDSFMAGTHVLPQLLAASLLNITLDEPGWADGRKFAGRAFAQLTSTFTLMDPSEAVVGASLENRENTVRLLDRLIHSLGILKENISAGEAETLQQHLEHIRSGREQWWLQREAGDWAGERPADLDLPSAREMLGQMFLGRRRKDK
jgi:prephenate dehydrogenase